MEDFLSYLEMCNLLSFDYQGDHFTWNNKNPEEGNVKECLDWVVAINEWSVIFPNFSLHHLRIFCLRLPSNLKPANKKTIRKDKKPNSQFSFESIWNGEPDCAHIFNC